MPRANQDFSPLDPAALETSTFTFDFVNFLGTGETISTATWSIASLLGIDASPSSRLVGTTSVNGTQVLQRIGTGVAGETYRITATITTSASQTLTLYAHCPCIAQQ
jgi:hypothetical protein